MFASPARPTPAVTDTTPRQEAALDELQRWISRRTRKDERELYPTAGAFWLVKQHQTEFPIVFKCFRAIFHLNASNACVERIFNLAGQLLDKNMCSVGADTAQGRMLLRMSARPDFSSYRNRKEYTREKMAQKRRQELCRWMAEGGRRKGCSQ
ncbi:hypothetical protein KIPB_011030 [Kipferlia bialata]|uniref:HAT C-terminal dimerisation domain-containing protein n=1 Tax=Kipferlia bialata TaxID=797122 RepID=A0A391NPZ0_9EUKA|nr:hypothetical protein KIPB_011030 [Kipferlia bialata]|eukprot:g11030.t1